MLECMARWHAECRALQGADSKLVRTRWRRASSSLSHGLDDAVAALSAAVLRQRTCGHPTADCFCTFAPAAHWPIGGAGDSRLPRCHHWAHRPSTPDHRCPGVTRSPVILSLASVIVHRAQPQCPWFVVGGQRGCTSGHIRRPSIHAAALLAQHRAVQDARPAHVASMPPSPAHFPCIRGLVGDRTKLSPQVAIIPCCPPMPSSLARQSKYGFTCGMPGTA